MLDQSAANTGIHPRQALVDAGYCSEANLAAAAARKDEHGTDTFMATGRLAHGEQVPAAPRGRIPKDATARERMARKLRAKPGRAAYARRNAIMERWIGSVRHELLNRTLIWNHEHLRQILHDYELHHNSHRPHMSLSAAAPLKPLPPNVTDLDTLRIRRTRRAGGVINEYRPAA